MKACKKDDGQKAISLVKKGGPELRDTKRKGERGNKQNQKV